MSTHPKAEKECDCCLMCSERGAVQHTPKEPKLHPGKCRDHWLRWLAEEASPRGARA